MGLSDADVKPGMAICIKLRFKCCEYKQQVSGVYLQRQGINDV